MKHSTLYIKSTINSSTVHLENTNNLTDNDDLGPKTAEKKRRDTEIIGIGKIPKQSRKEAQSDTS